MNVRLPVIILLLLTLAHAAGAQDAVPWQEKVVSQGQPIEHWSARNDSAIVSPDSAKLAYRIYDLAQVRIVWNGELSGAQHEVVGPRISPDSKRLTYLGRAGNQWRLFVDQRRLEQVPAPAAAPIFSPDSARVAYWGRDGKRTRLVLDGQSGSEFDRVLRETLTFSPDSRHVAFVAEVEGKWAMVVDDHPRAPYQVIGSPPLFSPDGRRLAYIASQGSQWFVVIDGQEESSFAQIAGGPVFSPDSRRYAYWASQPAGPWVLIENGRPVPGSECEQRGELLYSPDSRHLAAVLKRSGTWYVMLDGRLQLPCEAVGKASLTFSPNGQRLAYGGLLEGKWAIILDGVRQQPFDALLAASIRFSPDSKRLAYGVRHGEGWRIVLDDKPQDVVDAIDARSLTFSPDSQRLAYLATRSSRRLLIDGGLSIADFDDAADLLFSPDSRHLACLGQLDGQWFIAIDGRPSTGRYSGFVDGARLCFTSPRTLHTLAYQHPGPPYCRVEIDLADNVATLASESRDTSHSPHTAIVDSHLEAAVHPTHTRP